MAETPTPRRGETGRDNGSTAGGILPPTTLGFTPYERVLELLGDRVKTRRHNTATSLCPAHNDHKPSLSIKEADDGCVLLNCFAGCRTEEICSALGVEMSELFPPSSWRPECRQSVRPRYYTYVDQSGESWFRVAVIRVPGKPKDTWCEYKIDGQWRTKGGKRNGIVHVENAEGRTRLEAEWERTRKRQLPPFGLLGALESKDKSIFVAEGEKDVETLLDLGLLAITNPGGAGGLGRMSKRPFISAIKDRRVVVLPDNDPAGEDWATEVAALAGPRATDVRVVQLPGLPSKGDVTDWLQMGHEKDELLRLVDESSPTDPLTPEEMVQLKEGRKAAAREERDEAIAGEVERLNSIIFRNFAVREGTPKPERIAEPIAEIARRTIEGCGGEPRRLGDDLFVDRGSLITFLPTPASLFAVMYSHGPVSWAQGRDCESKDFVTKPEFHAGLALHSEQVSAISPVPLEPQPPDVYVLRNADVVGVDTTKGRIGQLLEHFRFVEPRDAAMAQALLLSQFWGGPSGARPLFVITGPDGIGPQGSGKTTLAEVLLGVAAPPFRLEMSRFGDSARKQLLSDSAMTAVGVLVDNVRSICSTEMADLLTAAHIDGRPSHGTQRRRENRMTWVITSVAPELDSDHSGTSHITFSAVADRVSRGWLRPLQGYVFLELTVPGLLGNPVPKLLLFHSSNRGREER